MWHRPLHCMSPPPTWLTTPKTVGPKRASLLCFGICQEQTRHIVVNYFQVRILTPPKFPFCCNLQSTHTIIQSSAVNGVAGNHRVRRTPRNDEHVFQPKWDPRRHHSHSPTQSAIPNILLLLFDRWMFCVWICQPLRIVMINCRNPIGCKNWLAVLFGINRLFNQIKILLG